MLQVKATQERLLERDVGVLVVICGPGQVAGFASVNSLANHTSRARSAASLVKSGSSGCSTGVALLPALTERLNGRGDAPRWQ